MNVWHYAIFYMVDDKNRTVSFFKIINAMMDLPNRLMEI